MISSLLAITIYQQLQKEVHCHSPSTNLPLCYGGKPNEKFEMMMNFKTFIDKGDLHRLSFSRNNTFD